MLTARENKSKTVWNNSHCNNVVTETIKFVCRVDLPAKFVCNNSLYVWSCYALNGICGVPMACVAFLACAKFGRQKDFVVLHHLFKDY